MMPPDPAEDKPPTPRSWAEILGTRQAHPTPQHDPFCGRCGGPSGPEGAWCDNCIRECKENTRRLDLQREAEL